MENINREKQRIIKGSGAIIKGRWLYATTLILTGITTKIIGGSNNNFPLKLMLFILLIGVSTNIIYGMALKKGDKLSVSTLKRLGFIQLLSDQLFFILIIFYSGGMTSISSLYFFYGIIASAFIFYLPGIILVSSLASFLYLGLILGQFYEIIPYLPRYNLPFEQTFFQNPSAVIPTLFATISSFYVVGIFSGIIAKNLRKNEEELVMEKNKAESIISNLSDGLIFINPQGKISIFNKKAERIFRTSSSEILGKTEKEIRNKEIKKIIAEKGEKEIKTDTGKTLKIFNIFIKGKDKDNGRAIIIYDISRDKFLDKMKSEFIMIMGHQLRTPLSAIKSAIHGLKTGDYGRINKEQKEILEKSSRYVEKTITLIKDLLESSSMEEGRFNYVFKNENVSQFINEIMEEIKSRATFKKTKVKMECSEDFPETIRMDAEKMKFALKEILLNAIEYSPPGEEVIFYCKKEGDKILFKIEDNGIGIPEEAENKIFNKFFRAPNAITFQTEGNGLALHIAKNIVHAHSGEISFKNKKNKGTIFSVELPVKN